MRKSDIARCVGEIYTRSKENWDDEECDNLCDGSDDLCVNGCGSEHCWNGYTRTVIEAEGE